MEDTQKKTRLEEERKDTSEMHLASDSFIQVVLVHSGV